jgi:hypothetical protein
MVDKPPPPVIFVRTDISWWRVIRAAIGALAVAAIVGLVWRWAHWHGSRVVPFGVFLFVMSLLQPSPIRPGPPRMRRLTGALLAGIVGALLYALLLRVL